MVDGSNRDSTIKKLHQKCRQNGHQFFASLPERFTQQVNENTRLAFSIANVVNKQALTFIPTWWKGLCLANVSSIVNKPDMLFEGLAALTV